MTTNTNNNTEAKTPTKMSYNPLNNTLQTLEIKDKTIENYFNQIKTKFLFSSESTLSNRQRFV